MSYQVTLNTGSSNVVLPDGLRHRGGDTVTLTDNEYGTLSANALSTLFSSVVNLNGMMRLAATAVTGFALQNATPTILSWTAPNDGSQHRILAFGSAEITSAATGGSVALVIVPPSGATGFPTVISGGQGTGFSYNGPYGLPYIVGPNTTVSLVQGSALTAGAVTVWAEIWGS